MTTLIITNKETEVLERAKAGDRAAFGELVKMYQKRAYAIAYGFLGNRDDALDIAQDSFVKAYRAMDRFDTSMPFYPWLYRIVKNTSLNRIKRKKRRGETSLDHLRDKGMEFSEKKVRADRGAILGELRGSIAEALQRVSDDHREILLLRHVHELSYHEIAECLRVPKGTVMSRLHGARKRLRDALTELERSSGAGPELGATL